MKRKVIVLIAVFLLAIVSFAEKSIDQIIAELEKKLPTVPEKEKVGVLNELAYEYQEQYPERCIKYANQALELSQKRNDVRGKAVALKNIGIGCRSLAKYKDAIGYGQQALEIFKSSGDEKGVSDSLIDVGTAFIYIGKLEKAEEYLGNALEIKTKIGEKKGIARCLSYLGVINWIRGKYDEAMGLHEKSLKINEEIGDKKAIANSLNHIGMVYQDLSNYQKALEYYYKALEIRRELGNKKIIADSLNNIGIVYKKIGSYEKSLQYQLQSLEIKEQIEDKKGIATSLNNIGNIYRLLGNFQKALDYYLSSLEIKREIGFKNGITHSLNNIGLAYQSLKKPRKALDYYLQSLALTKEIGNKKGCADSILNIGLVYLDLHDYDKSITYLLEALELSEAIKNKSGIANASFNIGGVYTEMRQYDKAIPYIERCLKIGKEIEDLNLLRWGNKVFSDIYSAKGNYKKALEYYQLYFKVNEEIFNKESSKQIAEMQIRYDLLTKEKRIENLEKDNEIQKLRLSRQEFTRNAFIAGFILVSIILVLLFRKYLYLFSFWKKQKYIGQFRLVEEIGSGGMGVIYKAHGIRDKTDTAAVKVLKPELFKDETGRKRFVQEAAIIDKLDHPNIVKIIQRGQSKDKLFIAMELLQGKTLDVKIDEEGQVDLKECFHIMIQVSDALVLIHDKEIIHRDLKPSNIMLIRRDRDPNFVKLLDFGIAKMKFQTSITRTGILVGSINYMSPEQLANSEFSSASDVYSLGVTFYQMITGRIVFPGDTANEITRQVLDTSPIEPERFRPDIPGELSDLIMKMLDKDKGSRPSIKEIFETLRLIQSKYN